MPGFYKIFMYLCIWSEMDTLIDPSIFENAVVCWTIVSKLGTALKLPVGVTGWITMAAWIFWFSAFHFPISSTYGIRSFASPVLRDIEFEVYACLPEINIFLFLMDCKAAFPNLISQSFYKILPFSSCIEVLSLRAESSRNFHSRLSTCVVPFVSKNNLLLFSFKILAVAIRIRAESWVRCP